MSDVGEKPAEDTTSKRLDYSWLVDLDSTLSSVEGSKAFESYLARCGMLPLLEFIWACDGMKSLVNESPSKSDQLVSCIYKNYIISGALPNLSNNVVLEIARCLEEYFENPEPSAIYPVQQPMLNLIEPKNLNLDIFDEAKREVEMYLKDSTFPKFRKAVENGNVCVGINRDDDLTYEVVEKGDSLSHQRSSRGKLASHPEAFARALCEKLEGLRVSRNHQ